MDLILKRMNEIAQDFYTERDGGRWYVIARSLEHERIAEEFVKRDDARRFILWLAGDPLPEGWTFKAHGDGRISYDITIPGQYSPATIWIREARKVCPNLLSTREDTMTFKATWNETTEANYDYGLGVLPPALMTGYGFLVGEPFDHRTCAVSGGLRATYSAFVRAGDKFYTASTALTVPEFRMFKPEHLTS